MRARVEIPVGAVAAIALTSSARDRPRAGFRRPGAILEFPAVRRAHAASHSWRVGDTALAGASHVRIAALERGTALVVGEGPFGPWSIWMDASKLRRTEALIDTLA